MSGNSLIKYTIYFIWTFILFVMIYDLFISPARSIFWMMELVVVVYIYYKLTMPVSVYMLVVALGLANIFGEHFLGLFYTISNYDKWLHILGPVAGGAFFYYLFDKKIPDKRVLVLFSVSLVFSCSLLWEAIEYFYDRMFELHLTGVHVRIFDGRKFSQVMSPLQDENYDLLSTIIGSLIFAAGAAFGLKKRSKH